jgi:hypothetical protein
MEFRLPNRSRAIDKFSMAFEKALPERQLDHV